MSEDFSQRKQRNIDLLGADSALRQRSVDWIIASSKHGYSYHFEWLGRPIIQFPPDIVAIQELIWKVKPTLVIETGVAHGGSLILSASILELLGGERKVLGIDVDIRAHNRVAIENHPLSHRIDMIEGSSIDATIVEQVNEVAKSHDTIMVILDSNHTHEHVARELELYSPIVTKGSYLVVFDTIIEDMPEDFFPDRPWGKGNNPKTAVREFLEKNTRFQLDREMDNKLLITVAPEGYLECVSE